MTLLQKVHVLSTNPCCLGKNEKVRLLDREKNRVVGVFYDLDSDLLFYDRHMRTAEELVKLLIFVTYSHRSQNISCCQTQ